VLFCHKGLTFLTTKKVIVIKALLFDFDGLILDTETPELLALQETYARYGQSLSAEMYGRAVGSEYGQAFEPLQHLRSLVSEPVEAEAFRPHPVNGNDLPLAPASWRCGRRE